MPHQRPKIQQASEENKKTRPEKQSVRGQRSYSMPNSLAGAVPMMPSSGTPNSVMREMDPEDSGVLFRGRGFDSSVGAHELSHTVRRQPVPAPVTRTVPSGTIQRALDDDDDFLNVRESEESDFEYVDENLAEAPPTSKEYKAATAAQNRQHKLYKEQKKRAKKALEERRKTQAKIDAAAAAEQEKNEKARRKEAEKSGKMADNDFVTYNGRKGWRSDIPDTPKMSGALGAYYGSSVAKEEKKPGFFTRIKNLFSGEE